MRRALWHLFLLAIIAFWLGGCSIGDSDSDRSVNDTNTTETVLPPLFAPGDYGDIYLDANYTVPQNALFLDIRNRDEYEQKHAQGAVDGAIFEYRPQYVINDDFVQDVLQHPDVNGDKERYIILICNSGSRSAQAAQWLATPEDEEWNGRKGGGFRRVFHIVGGLHSWEEHGLPIVTP